MSFPFIDIPWYVYIIVFVMSLIPLWLRGYFNPIAYIENYLENRRLKEAIRLGLTWEQYKTKHNIRTEDNE